MGGLTFPTGGDPDRLRWTLVRETPRPLRRDVSLEWVGCWSGKLVYVSTRNTGVPGTPPPGPLLQWNAEQDDWEELPALPPVRTCSRRSVTGSDRTGSS